MATIMAKPEACICGREPVTARVRGGGWLVACPAGWACKHRPTSGRWPQESQAITAWNTAIYELKYKEGNK